MVMEEGKEYTEGDWTNTECASLDLYSKSKTLAERAAWDFVKELPGKNYFLPFWNDFLAFKVKCAKKNIYSTEDKKFELAVVNPGLVLGPVINGAISTSVEVLVQLLFKSFQVLHFKVKHFY